MRKALPFLGAAALLAAAALPSLSAPKMTARAVTHGFVRSNSVEAFIVETSRLPVPVQSLKKGVGIHVLREIALGKTIVLDLL